MQVLTEESNLVNIANSIRNKTGWKKVCPCGDGGCNSRD